MCRFLDIVTNWIGGTACIKMLKDDSTKLLSRPVDLENRVKL